MGAEVLDSIFEVKVIGGTGGWCTGVNAEDCEF